MEKIKESEYSYKVCEMSIKYSTKVKASERMQATDRDALYNIFRSVYDDDTIELYETCYAALLNHKLQVLGIIRIGEGDTTGTCINFRKAIQAAFLCNATAIALCHNHPTGNLKYSENDLRSTKEFKEMCRACKFKFIDHLIISTDDYFSFSDAGLIY